MKVCPTCQSTYDGAEAFCPNDGSRLQAQPVATGSLAGATLGGAVHLERLEFGDKMAERYSGRLLEGERPCYVTVFNATFSPAQNAPRLVETARAKVGSPVPKQLTTLLQVEFNHYPPFVIETAPRGSSLQRLLADRKKLDWKVAAKLTANVARLVEWLHGRGVTHHSLHPGSIYVTDLLHGRVQLGEWYSEEAQWVDNPMQTLASSPGRFVGYVSYMGPELAMKGRAGDLRSAVYALGVLLYELIVGRGPFSDPDPGEVLRRHLTEQPIRLSIARGGGEVPEDLDLVAMMMLEKDPNHRFQAPSAIIGALANLLGIEPLQLAPMIERGEVQEEDDAYSTIEMSQIDRDAVPGLLARRNFAVPEDLSSTSVLRKVETVQSPVAKAEARSSEHEALSHDTLIQTPAVSRGAEQLVDGGSTQKTLMFGNIGAMVDQAAAEQAARDATEEELAPTTSGTLRMVAPDFSSLGDESSKAEIIKPARIRAHEAETRDEVEPPRERQSSVEVDVSLLNEAKEQDSWERAAQEAEAKEAATKAAKAAAETAEKEAAEAAEAAAKRVAEAAEKAAAEAAAKVVAEAAEKAAAEAIEKAARKAEEAAREEIERVEFARIAAEKAAREDAEFRELEEAEERESAAKAAEAAKAAAEADALIEQAKREAEEKAAADKAEAEAKIAQEKAEAEARTAAEVAEKAARDASEKADREQAAADKAAADKKQADDRRAELNAASPDDDGGVSIPTFEMGTVAAKSGDASDEWFAGGEPAWDSALDEEHARESDTKNKHTLLVVLGVLAIVVIGFVVWIQFGTHDNVYDQGDGEPVAAVEEPVAVFDVAEQKRLFEASMEQGRLIAPFGNCALTVLELVKREAPTAPEYEEMRKAFVARVAEGAESADQAGDLNLARTLAGYGAQWDPENSALKKRADELQARYVGSFNAAQGEGKDAGAEAVDVGAAPIAPEVAPAEVPAVVPTNPVQETKPVQVAPVKTEVKTTQTPPVVTKVEPVKEAATVDTRQMLKDASAAYARGDVAQARAMYQELVKIDGGNPLVQSGLGQVYFDQAQYDDAVRHQLQAVKLKPSRTDYRVNLGQSYYRLGRFKEAIAAWEEVLRQDPDNANAKQYIELAKRKLN